MTPGAKRLDVVDLLPTADELWGQAYVATSGDPVVPRQGHRGVHGRRNHQKNDTGGKNKLGTWQAAGTGDISPFAAALSRLLKNSLPPSIRTRVKQAGKKDRPIDDPSEDKRVVLSHFHGVLEPQVEPLLHPGQYGRPLGDREPACPRDGATNLDHVAWCAFRPS